MQVEVDVRQVDAARTAMHPAVLWCSCSSSSSSSNSNSSSSNSSTVVALALVLLAAVLLPPAHAVTWL